MSSTRPPSFPLRRSPIAGPPPTPPLPSPPVDLRVSPLQARPRAGQVGGGAAQTRRGHNAGRGGPPARSVNGSGRAQCAARIRPGTRRAAGGCPRHGLCPLCPICPSGPSCRAVGLAVILARWSCSVAALLSWRGGPWGLGACFGCASSDCAIGGRCRRCRWAHGHACRVATKGRRLAHASVCDKVNASVSPAPYRRGRRFYLSRSLLCFICIRARAYTRRWAMTHGSRSACSDGARLSRRRQRSKWCEMLSMRAERQRCVRALADGHVPVSKPSGRRIGRASAL